MAPPKIACSTFLSTRATPFSFPPAPRTPSAPGWSLCEIQQHSDLTYRVFDYNRRDAQGKPRELHIEKALEVMRFGEQRGGKIEPVRIKRGAADGNLFRRLPLLRHRTMGIRRNASPQRLRPNISIC